ncbi:MAG TPA: hypothetical protein VIS96_18700 [Terrimicrobiaceae bacterium]
MIPVGALGMVAILVVGLAAHLGCLDSTFYLDDWVQILNSPNVEGGRWYEQRFRALTTLSYFLTWRAFGFSASWFHLFNLVLHLAGALAIYLIGPALLRIGKEPLCGSRASRVAWLAALLFVAHPLTTEITNYARARDHGLVGFFSFLAAGLTAIAVQRGSRWLAAAALSVVLASFSKDPGLPHALLSVALVVTATSSSEARCRLIPSRRVAYLLVTLAILAGFALAANVVDLAKIFYRQVLGDWRFGLHALTQGRVFWSYVSLWLWPWNRLCSDHLVAWTKSSADLESWFAVSALAALVLLVAWLWLRGRQPWALLAALALGAVGLRMLYVASELMVEYRAYPALPYVALLAALGLDHLARHRRRFAAIFTTALVAAWAVGSFLRSEDWSAPDRIRHQVLRRYPWQLRAINGLSAEDNRVGRWQEVLNRHEDFLQRLAAVLAENNRNSLRYYENWPLWAVTEDTLVAEALLHVRGHEAARQHLEAARHRMLANRIEEKMLIREWHFYAGLVEAAEKPDLARFHFLEALYGWRDWEARKRLQELEPALSPSFGSRPLHESGHPIYED